MSNTRKRRRRRNWPLLLLILLLAGVALFAAWQISGILYDYISARQTYDTIADNAIDTVLPALDDVSTPEPGSEAEIPFTVDWDYLRGVNPEVVGWLWCPDTMINYPVLQHTDTEYYLHHSFDGKYNPGGALFSDPACTLGTNLCNYIIYGHQMNDGSMFDLLNDYSDPATYDEHPLFYFLTPEASYRVELISAHIVEAVPDSYPAYFADENGYGQYLNDIMRLSYFRSTATPDTGCQLLTMSTCNYSRNFDDPRMLLHGLLVPIEQ